MATKKRIMEIISVPQYSKRIRESDIKNIKNLLFDFDFSTNDDYYNFLYGNLEIIISKNGSVLISIVSTSTPSEKLCFLSKIIDKINLIISVDNPSIKTRSCAI